MAAESVKIEVVGISTEIGREYENELSVVDSKPHKEFELVAGETGEPVGVILKDVELENSEDSPSHGGVGMADEGEGGPEHRGEGGKADSENQLLEEEDQEECGFCVFMKGGPCGERFSIWQDCVDSAEKSGEDIVDKCAQTTSLLKVCMEMNLEYYRPVLDAEKAMEDVASRDDNRTADSTGNPADHAKGTPDTSDKEGADKVIEVGVVSEEGQVTSEKESADSQGTGKVVEVVGVVYEDGQVTEVMEVVVEAAN